MSDYSCLICGQPADRAHYPRTKGYRNDTIKEQSDEIIAPFCRFHHNEQHRIGVFTFALKYIRELMRYWVKQYEQMLQDHRGYLKDGARKQTTAWFLWFLTQIAREAHGQKTDK